MSLRLKRSMGEGFKMISVLSMLIELKGGIKKNELFKKFKCVV